MTVVTSNPKKIHLIFKTHLDVGFTDFAEKVVTNYFKNYIPRAILLARKQRERNGAERFIWTTGSWLIYEYLEQANSEQRSEMEEAILMGDIAWHALPFTTHSENMDESLFRFGLSLSQKLDQRFGKTTIAAKMTDVPGHTQSIVPLLSEAGVQFLHIGVNGASTAPDVPPIFVWRHPAGAEVLVMYHKGSYGDLMMVPDLAHAIYFAHTGDNLGPQGDRELHDTYGALRQQFPYTTIEASTLDNFAHQLLTIRNILPVITQEIGDTWIHGIGSDPTKIRHYRALLRLRNHWLARGVQVENIQNFSRRLLLVPEHTWGLDIKTHLNDWDHYSKIDFLPLRNSENFKKVEASWGEQRAYLSQAINHLQEDGMRKEALDAITSSDPCLPIQTNYEPITNFGGRFETSFFTFEIEPYSGTIKSLIQKDSGKEWTGNQNSLARFWYQTFSAQDYRRFYRQYNKNKKSTSEWAIPDFTKPGIDKANAQSQTFSPQLAWLGQRQITETGFTEFLFLYKMPEESWQTFGAPRNITLQLLFSHDKPTIFFDLQWFNKSACRLPEALWFSFNPKVSPTHGWRLDKMGYWISPLEVIKNGNRHMHAVCKGVKHQSKDDLLEIDTLDAPLVAPGTPALLNFTNRQPDLEQGIHFNLYNNLWGTNFPMWFEDDARYRFILKFSDH